MSHGAQLILPKPGGANRASHLPAQERFQSDGSAWLLGAWDFGADPSCLSARHTAQELLLSRVTAPEPCRTVWGTAMGCLRLSALFQVSRGW